MLCRRRSRWFPSILHIYYWVHDLLAADVFSVPVCVCVCVSFLWISGSLPLGICRHILLVIQSTKNGHPMLSSVAILPHSVSHFIIWRRAFFPVARGLSARHFTHYSNQMPWKRIFILSCPTSLLNSALQQQHQCILQIAMSFILRHLTDCIQLI